MLLGYARVSTVDQTLETQLLQLRAAGCDRTFQEKISGRKDDRPELSAMLEELGAGDVVMVTKLDRLGRNARGLLELTEEITKRGATFRSLAEAIDTSGAMGRLFFQIMAALAEFEVSQLRERTQSGLATARTNGRIGGRRPKLGATARQSIRERLSAGETRKDLAACYGVGTTTIDRIRKESSE
jgi:DNA invertase Pin-like site-specific DNA recombinase